MPDLKIALIGAGSFVFGPGVLRQAFLDNRLNGIELALMDVDADAVEGMAGVGRRMAREQGLDSTVTAHTDLGTAVEGADFVISAAARQLARQHQWDREIIAQYLPGHLVTEFGGVAGVSYTVRQVALFEEIAAVLRARCPGAWLLNVSNPLPRVCQATHEAGVPTVGFCSVSACVLSALWLYFEGEPLVYPWARAEERFEITLGGLNHFCWLLGARDRRTGADLLPLLRARWKRGEGTGNPVCERIARETGYLLLPNDLHTSDFLPPSPETPPPHEPYHGTPDERAARLNLLREMAEGRADYAPLLTRPVWERPVDWIAAVARGTDARFHAVNLVNDGITPDLPQHQYVETGCQIRNGTVEPNRFRLPEDVMPYVTPVAEQHDRLTRACQTRSHRLLMEAVDADPTILDKEAGKRAVDACLAARGDALPAFR